MSHKVKNQEICQCVLSLVQRAKIAKGSEALNLAKAASNITDVMRELDSMNIDTNIMKP